jgi:hypothetical protein
VNVAYIISAYRLPGLLVRLVERIDVPGASIYIHVDARSPGAVYDAMAGPLAGRPNVSFLPRHACRWGDFGHVEATLKGLRALLASGRPFDYVVLLTGQDYPLKSNAAIAAALSDAGGRVFLDWMPIPSEKWTDGGLDRIENRHFRLGRRILAFPGAPFRSTLAGAAWSRAARLLRLRRDFPSGLRPYGGSSYWMMPADCARHVAEFVRDRPDYVRFFRRVLVPDEMFFHSIVMNSRFRDRVDGNPLRFVDWDDDGDHPKVLTSDDVERLMATPDLFGRKFDPGVDEEVLDLIDAAITGGE